MIGLLYGSPKAKGSTSMRLIEALQKELNTEETILISALKPDYERLDSCDCLIMVFPLYVDAVPGHLLQLLTEYEARRSGKTKLVYALCHCGFYEGSQCRPALEIVNHFCTHTEFTFCGGIGLGGALLLGSGTAPSGAEAPLRHAITQLAHAVTDKTALPSSVYAHMKFPRSLYIFGGNIMWKQEGKRQGLTVRDLYKTN